jgi:hypothetical protein
VQRSSVSALLACVLLSGGCAQGRDWWQRFGKHAPVLTETQSADLPAPKGLRATSGAYRMIPLKWDPLLRGEIGGYLLERAAARDGPYEQLAAVWGRGAISYIDRGDPEHPLADAATRFYRLRAFTPEGHLSVVSSPAVAGTTAPLPDPPGGLRAYSRQPREVPLSWTASDDPLVAGYVIERSPTTDGRYASVARLEGRFDTTYVDANLGDLRVFYYRVAAFNAAGATGPLSPPVRAVTKPEPLPPRGPHVVEHALGVNVLAWEPNVEPDIASYRLLRVRSGGAPSVVATLPADVQKGRDDDVAAGEIVDYRVVAVDRDGLASRPSEDVRVTSEGYALQASVEQDGVHLHWNARSEDGFHGARVVRSAWFARPKTASTEGGEYVDRDVRPGHRYRYQVILERADGGDAPASQPLWVQVPKDADLR